MCIAMSNSKVPARTDESTTSEGLASDPVFGGRGDSADRAALGGDGCAAFATWVSGWGVRHRMESDVPVDACRMEHAHAARIGVPSALSAVDTGRWFLARLAGGACACVRNARSDDRDGATVPARGSRGRAGRHSDTVSASLGDFVSRGVRLNSWVGAIQSCAARAGAHVPKAGPSRFRHGRIKSGHDDEWDCWQSSAQP